MKAETRKQRVIFLSNYPRDAEHADASIGITWVWLLGQIAPLAFSLQRQSKEPLLSRKSRKFSAFKHSTLFQPRYECILEGKIINVIHTAHRYPQGIKGSTWK